MSKSYRKPYSAITGLRSAHRDKTLAARSFRRTQNFSLRTALANEVDWDEFLLPDIYECADNEVYGWSRDGNQRLQTHSSQYNNPFSYVLSPTWMTIEEIMERWEERKQRDDDWMTYICRK
jgi:hypothetical protein